MLTPRVMNNLVKRSVRFSSDSFTLEKFVAFASHEIIPTEGPVFIYILLLYIIVGFINITFRAFLGLEWNLNGPDLVGVILPSTVSHLGVTFLVFIHFFCIACKVSISYDWTLIPFSIVFYSMVACLGNLPTSILVWTLILIGIIRKKNGKITIETRPR